ncbi:ABC transporter permease [Leifsonia sp. LS-T14]|uniref:ABC transporter permease n=1 Tax=unclassified Leifsonia TaxID=2663824 RepID=UPI0035A65E5B
MTTMVTPTDTTTPPSATKGRRRYKGIGLGVYAFLALAFLLIPIVYTFIFSFNDAIKNNIAWRGFTLRNWTNVCDAAGICDAFTASITIGIISTVIATTLGTMIAIALMRYRFRFRSQTSLLLFLPMASPEVVLGAGLAAQFLSLGVNKGFLTIIIAHVMFCISFVVVTVKARVASLDPALEEAGRDLYGSPNAVFWRITFPLLLPGILSAALLSFSLSFDDFIITNFNAGAVTTFPMYIYIAASRGIPAQANVIASAVFILTLLVVLISQLTAAARARRLARR